MLSSLAHEELSQPRNALAITLLPQLLACLREGLHQEACQSQRSLRCSPSAHWAPPTCPPGVVRGPGTWAEPSAPGRCPACRQESAFRVTQERSCLDQGGTAGRWQSRVPEEALIPKPVLFSAALHPLCVRAGPARRAAPSRGLHGSDSYCEKGIRVVLRASGPPDSILSGLEPFLPTPGMIVRLSVTVLRSPGYREPHPEVTLLHGAHGQPLTGGICAQIEGANASEGLQRKREMAHTTWQTVALPAPPPGEGLRLEAHFGGEGGRDRQCLDGEAPRESRLPPPGPHAGGCPGSRGNAKGRARHLCGKLPHTQSHREKNHRQRRWWGGTSNTPDQHASHCRQRSWERRKDWTRSVRGDPRAAGSAGRGRWMLGPEGRQWEHRRDPGRPRRADDRTVRELWVRRQDSAGGSGAG
ncbi:uncharacterized protein [Vicugna pacos]|uniref:Uncharacterized protein isoform X2 n=1 Tax=Vicugna pacos TaxID=30538 RepID=A0ABM5CK56_VICPA